MSVEKYQKLSNRQKIASNFVNYWLFLELNYIIKLSNFIEVLFFFIFFQI